MTDKVIMKNIIMLLLVVSCGKGADGKKIAQPVQNLSIVQSGQEMVMTICMNDKDCSEACTKVFVACTDPCGGQNTSYQWLLQNPIMAECQDKCRAESNACYNSPKEITKEAWLLITGPTE